MGPKTLEVCHTLQNIFPPVSYNHEVCSSYTQIRRCFLFNVKFSSLLGIYTGTLSCIVKLADEVCARRTKRVGDIKQFCNSRRSQKCCSLVYPFKNILGVSQPFVWDMSPKCIDREGLGDAAQGLGKRRSSNNISHATTFFLRIPLTLPNSFFQA